MPDIASEPLSACDVVAGKAKPGGLPGLVRSDRRQSVVDRSPRTSAKAPAAAAIATATSDLFGLPPSTEGAISRRLFFFLPARLAIFQTAQPTIAFRLLITLMKIRYPPYPSAHPQRNVRGRRAGTAPERGERTSRFVRSRPDGNLATRSVRRPASGFEAPGAARAGTARSSRTLHICADASAGAGALARRGIHRGRARSLARQEYNAPLGPSDRADAGQRLFFLAFRAVLAAATSPSEVWPSPTQPVSTPSRASSGGLPSSTAQAAASPNRRLLSPWPSARSRRRPPPARARIGHPRKVCRSQAHCRASRRG